MKKIVVLISGRGSNFEALLSAQRAGQLGGEIVLVLSNRSDAAGLQTAEKAGIATAVLSHKAFASREAYDAQLMTLIDAANPDLVVLAGFMRLLSADFTAHYEQRLLNIHPALLPAFPGLHTHQRALDEGVKVHGCTVHFVTPDLDCGPIIIQAAVPVLADDDEDRLAARVLREEHRIYPQAVRWFLQNRLRVTAGVVRVLDPLGATENDESSEKTEKTDTAALHSPPLE